MSLESIVLCSPCLSLSLLFCLDLCTSSEHCWVTRLPLAFASGTRVHLWGGAFPVGGGVASFSSFRCESKDRACSQHEWGRQGAPVMYSSGGGTERAAFLAGGHCARAVPSWVSLTADSGALAGPVGAGLTSDRQRRTDTCRRGQHCPLIPVACRGRLPVL